MGKPSVSLRYTFTCAVARKMKYQSEQEQGCMSPQEEIRAALDRRWMLCLLLILERARSTASNWHAYINILPTRYGASVPRLTLFLPQHWLELLRQPTLWLSDPWNVQLQRIRSGGPERSWSCSGERDQAPLLPFTRRAYSACASGVPASAAYRGAPAVDQVASATLFWAACLSRVLAHYLGCCSQGARWC